MDNEVLEKEDLREGVEWKEHVSHKGKKFLVGYVKKDQVTKSEDTELLRGDTFDIPVYWRAEFSTGPGVPWQNTDSSTKNVTGIEKYALYNPYNPSYQWELDISVMHYREIVGYTFYDETGDGYTLLVWNTYIPHYVQYNSTGPDIMRIKGDIDHGGFA